MSRAIVLDTSPLSLVTNPRLSAESVACVQWLQAHLTSGSRVIVPQIADYEVRRDLNPPTTSKFQLKGEANASQTSRATFPR